MFFPEHVNTEEKLDRVVARVCQFRSFLMYHIKAAKSQLHARMRFRVDELLKVLRRAHTSDPNETKKAKTFTGKTFKRQ